MTRKPKSPITADSKSREIFIPQDDRTRPVTVEMYEAERKRAVAGIEPVVYALWDAANVFELMGHCHEDHAKLASLANLCAARLKALADNEGEHLLILHRRLNAPETTKSPTEQPK